MDFETYALLKNHIDKLSFNEKAEVPSTQQDKGKVVTVNSEGDKILEYPSAISYKYAYKMQETESAVLFCVNVGETEPCTYFIPGETKITTLRIYKNGEAVEGSQLATQTPYDKFRVVECNETRVYLILSNSNSYTASYFYYFSKGKWEIKVEQYPLTELENMFIGFDNEKEFTPESDYQPTTKKYVDDECRKLSSEKADKNVIVNIAKTTSDDGTAVYSADKTFEEIETAISDCKEVKVKFNATYYRMVQHNVGRNIWFQCCNQSSAGIIHYKIEADNTVTLVYEPVQATKDRVDELSANSTTSQYPSAKAVVDYVSNLLIETVLDNDNNYIANVTWEDIEKAFHGGKNIYVYDSNKIRLYQITDVNISDTDYHSLITGFFTVHNGSNCLAGKIYNSAKGVIVVYPTIIDE